jgi:hypothetical protein
VGAASEGPKSASRISSSLNCVFMGEISSN